MISFQTQFAATPSASSHTLPSSDVPECQKEPTAQVVAPRIFDEEHDLKSYSDLELAQYIEHCGIQLLAAHKLYEEFRTDAMKECRKNWLKLQSKALWERSRRPNLVDAMTYEIAQRIANEPGMQPQAVKGGNGAAN